MTGKYEERSRQGNVSCAVIIRGHRNDFMFPKRCIRPDRLVRSIGYFRQLHIVVKKFNLANGAVAIKSSGSKVYIAGNEKIGVVDGQSKGDCWRLVRRPLGKP